MGKKGRESRNGTEPGAVRLEELLAAWARGEPHAADVKSALAGFAAWLPYLSRRLQSGSARLRKAALRALHESGTRSGRDAVVDAAKSGALPAWLRLYAIELCGGDAPVDVAADLRGAASAAGDGGDVGELPTEERKLRLQLMVDRGDGAALGALFGARPDFDAEILAAIVEHETPDAGQLLLGLFGRLPELPDAERRLRDKELRRAWHALRQRGIALAEPRAERATATAPPAPAKSATSLAFTSHIDGEGSRVLVIACERPDEGGIDLLQLIVNEDSGLLSYTRNYLPRRELRSLIADLTRGDKELRLCPMDATWAWEVIRRAYNQSRRQSRDVPEQYVREHHVFEIRAPEAGTLRPEAWTAFTEGEIASVEAGRTADLLKEPELRSWGLEAREIEEAAAAYGELAESPIVVNPELKRGRAEEELQRQIEARFDEARRELWRQRLEEMAGYFLRSDRREKGLLALAGSLTLRAPDGAAKSPFLLALWRARIEAYLEAKKRSSQDDLIVKPGQR